MNNIDSTTLESMKRGLYEQVNEWLGQDIPDKGDDDYGRWQSMLAEINAIESLEDIVNYLESEGRDVDEFIEYYFENQI